MNNVVKAILTPPAGVAAGAAIIWSVQQIPEYWVGIALILTTWVLCSLVVYLLWSD